MEKYASHVWRAEVNARLVKFQLKNEAMDYKEERRIWHKKHIAKNPSARGWEDMWKKYEPIVIEKEAELEIQKQNKERERAEKERERAEKERERAEKEKQKKQESLPTISGIPDDIDSCLDPEYTEKDRGRRLKDAILWVAEEFCRVIRDEEDGPRANLSAASTPPPNAFAVFTLITYALSPIEKRRELITKALMYSDKSSDPEPPQQQPKPKKGSTFLDNIT